MKSYEFLEHTADIKFRASGKTLEDVFRNSALALANSMSENRIKSTISKRIKVKGKDRESLLYNFLEEFLFLFDSENFILSEIKSINIDEKNFTLEAEVSGDDAGNYEIKMHVKAITYNDMFVKKQKDKWVSQVVLDI